MNRKITKTVVDAADFRERNVFVWDTEIRGFGLKVTPGGKKMYVLQYRMGGRGHPTRRYTIGPHGPLTPDQARNMALELRAKVAKGIDPGKERVRIHRQALSSGANTFGRLAETYIKRECPRLARGLDVASVIHREILPHWSDVPVMELRKRDAIALTDHLIDAGKPAAALKLYEVIKRIGNWLVERDELEVSPFANMKPPAKRTIRDRSLKDHEIAAIWSVCGEIGYPFGPVLRLLLLSGQRRNEVAEMRWGELDLDNREWLIPGERSKNSKPHLIPLSDQVLEIIDSLPHFGGPFVFSGTDGRRPVSGFSKVKHRIDHLSGVNAWRLHDLRRTVRTGMAALRVPETVSEKVLNHQPDVLARTYNVHTYDAEKREALERWAHHVMDVVTQPSANVVPMNRTS